MAALKRLCVGFGGGSYALGDIVEDVEIFGEPKCSVSRLGIAATK